MARLGPPFWSQKSARKSLCGSLFCVLSQEMRHINVFLEAQNGVFWVRAKKLMLKKLIILFMCFFGPLNFSELIALTVRALSRCKARALHRVFARVAGELWAADPSKCPGRHEANASSRAQSEALRRSWEPGRQQHPGSEHQDSQDMLNQARRSFPWLLQLPTLTILNYIIISDTKKEHKPKLLSPDIFRWGGGLPHEGVGAKKFGMALETREIKLSWRDIQGFCWDIPEVPEKFEKKRFVFNFRSLTLEIILKQTAVGSLLEPVVPRSPRESFRGQPDLGDYDLSCYLERCP